MELTITQPDDWHVHLRDGAFLERTVEDIAHHFGRAIVMPNLKPPVSKLSLAEEYRARICRHIPEGSSFKPLMTLYLTDNIDLDDVAKIKDSDLVHGIKLYPAGATTNSEHGLTRIENGFAALEIMSEAGVPLLIHGESTLPDVDVFDREKRFIDDTLSVIIQRFPDLKIVFEHITTKDAAQFVKEAPSDMAATITPQHLLLNRNALFDGGIRPHHYCLPVLKRESHREALIEAATSGNPRFFLGSDSAPHTQSSKETACGCAGIYSAHLGLALYAEIFEQHNALDKLEGFASFFGPDFYRLPRNTKKVKLVKKATTVPQTLRFGDEALVPFLAGTDVSWQVTLVDH